MLLLNVVPLFSSVPRLHFRIFNDSQFNQRHWQICDIDLFAVWLNFKFLIAVLLILYFVFVFPDARNGDFKNLGRAHITWAPWKCCRSTSVTYRLIANWIYWCLLQPLRSNIVNKLTCHVLQKWGFAVQILNVTQTEIQHADCLCFSPYHPFYCKWTVENNAFWTTRMY